MTGVLEVDMRPGGACGDSPSAALGRLTGRIDAEKPGTVKVRLDPSTLSPNALRVILSQKGYELVETVRSSENDVTLVFSRKR